MRPPSTPPASRFLLRWLLPLLLLLPALSRAQTPWIQSQRVGTEVRFLYGNSIQRYNLATKAWLTAITLPRSGATAFTGDDLGNVVAYGTSIYRYNTSWASEVASGTTNSAVSHLFIDGTLLIAVLSAGLYCRITTITRGTGTVITTGIRDGGWVEVVSGLAEGDQIVAKAGAFVTDGDKINPISAATN